MLNKIDYEYKIKKVDEKVFILIVFCGRFGSVSENICTVSLEYG